MNRPGTRVPGERTGGGPRLLLSFDIDWAPDWAVRDCAALCLRHGWDATFFATHDSPVNSWLASQDAFEVGIHPNFMPGSSHGVVPEQVLDTCVKIVPGATAMRTHGFIGSNNLSAMVASSYPQIQVDCSVFLPFHRNLEPNVRSFPGGRTLTTVPTWLSDMACSAYPGWSWRRLPPTSVGTCLINVHPIHVALNSHDSESYGALRGHLRAMPLSDVTREQLAGFVNPKPGVRTWLENLLARRRCARPGTLTAYARTRRARSTGDNE